jgi:uncharacterized protein (DUF2252 family)
MPDSTTLPSVADRIVAFNQTFKPARVRLKFDRMEAGVFPFFRGTDHLFADYWPMLRPVDLGPEILICGDLHADNFGAFCTDQGKFRFDINDFDEALVASCSFDLVRCVTSIFLAAEAWGWQAFEAMQHARTLVDHYRAELALPAETPSLEADECPLGLQKLVVATAAINSDEVVARYTSVDKKTGQTLIQRDNDKFPEIRRERLVQIRDVVEQYGREQLQSPDFHVLDVTGRLAGIGSLGVRRYLILIEVAHSASPLRLLDIKECRRSSVLACGAAAQPSQWKNEAERVISAQRHLQASPAAGLGEIELDERPYRVRQMIADENRSRLERLKGSVAEFAMALEALGQITARSHRRGARFVSSDRETELLQWSRQMNIDQILLSSSGFADQTNRDFHEFQKARQSRAFSSIEG